MRRSIKSTNTRRYRDSRTKRRIMDRAVRHLKYNDGIKDIVDKFKSKIQEVIAQFKAAPGGRKIVSLLYSALSAANAVYAAKSLAELTSNAKKLSSLKKELGVAHSEFEAIGPGSDKINDQKYQVLLSSLRLVMSLMATIVSAVNAKLAIAKKQVQEGEDEERIIAETMTR